MSGLDWKTATSRRRLEDSTQEGTLCRIHIHNDVSSRVSSEAGNLSHHYPPFSPLHGTTTNATRNYKPGTHQVCEVMIGSQFQEETFRRWSQKIPDIQ